VAWLQKMPPRGGREGGRDGRRRRKISHSLSEMEDGGREGGRGGRTAVREDLVLLGEEGATRVDHVNAGQLVLSCNFLGPQMLLDRDGVVCTLTREGGREGGREV